MADILGWDASLEHPVKVNIMSEGPDNGGVNGVLSLVQDGSSVPVEAMGVNVSGLQRTRARDGGMVAVGA